MILLSSSINAQTIEISYSSSDLSSPFKITFTKLNDHYGIDISTVVNREKFANNITESFGELILGISSKMVVQLNQPYQDSIYILPDGKFNFQLSYKVDNAAFDIIRKNKIENLTVKHGGAKIELYIKRKSQLKLLELVNSIN